MKAYKRGKEGEVEEKSKTKRTCVDKTSSLFSYMFDVDEKSESESESERDRDRDRDRELASRCMEQQEEYVLYVWMYMTRDEIVKRQKSKREMNRIS